MKKSLVSTLIFLSPLLLMAQASKSYTLKGDVSSIPDADSITLSYRSEGANFREKAPVVSGKYEFKGELNEPTMAGISIKYKTPAGSPQKAMSMMRDRASVFLEPSTLTVKSVDSFSNIKVSGSMAHADYEKLEQMQKPYNEKFKDFNLRYREAQKNNDKATMEKIDKEWESTYNTMREDVYGGFVRKNPNSPIALYAFGQYAGYDLDPEKVEPIFKSLPAATQASYSGKEWQERINIAKVTGIGKQAPDFTQDDTLGIPVSLSSLKGKYVLVDFWASWCGPCRQENPNVVKAFNKYKEKGFHIMGVSLDQPNAKEKWMKAIHDDNLTWTHVSDLKYWDNAVAKQYGIQAIPQNLLIDPKGVIVAKNLRGEDLDKKLSEFLK
jgi:peroxiredoxin